MKENILSKIEETSFYGIQKDLCESIYHWKILSEKERETLKLEFPHQKPEEIAWIMKEPARDECLSFFAANGIEVEKLQTELESLIYENMEEKSIQDFEQVYNYCCMMGYQLKRHFDSVELKSRSNPALDPCLWCVQDLLKRREPFFAWRIQDLAGEDQVILMHHVRAGWHVVSLKPGQSPTGDWADFDLYANMNDNGFRLTL